MNKKLKIVRVVTSSHVVPWHLENTLKRLTKDFEVCVVGDGVSFYKDLYPDVKWVDIKIPRKINLISDVLALVSLGRFFIAYKPDIVHSVMHKAALLTAIAGFICRVPIRINTFTSQYWATKSGLPRVVYYISDWLINALDTYCLTDSPSQSEFLYEHKISKSGKPLPVLLKGSLSGVDVTRFNAQALPKNALNLRAELGLGEDEFIFLFLARKSIDKGVIDLLKAFAIVGKLHPEAKLLFVGPDESNGEIDWLFKSNPQIFNNVVNVNSEVSNREVYLAISNVLCLPSYREGFGSIVIDAAAQEVPTIGSNIPGLIDSIQDGVTGILFPKGDIEALTQVMLDFLDDNDKYKKMGLAARLRVEQYFTADLLYDSLKKLYIELGKKEIFLA